jgi:hypothetical protein
VKSGETTASASASVEAMRRGGRRRTGTRSSRNEFDLGWAVTDQRRR